VTVVFYSMAISHPCRTVRAMLDLKQVDYELVEVPTGFQRVRLPLAGFRAGTVPAVKFDGERIQGSRAIARALDERFPEPPLFPAQPGQRAAVDEAERWGEEEFQPVPRRLFRFALARYPSLRAWVIGRQRLPAVAPVDFAVKVISAGYARTIEADGRRAVEAGIRADLAALPALLARADRLLADGTLTVDPPNAATLQVFSTVATLHAFEDLRAFVAAHACAEPALDLFGRGADTLPPVFEPAWLAPILEQG
jgi:glutathione S-transferase